MVYARRIWVVDEEGCNEPVRHSLRKAHLKACDYRPILCPSGGEKCGRVPKMEMEDHLDLECPYSGRKKNERGLYTGGGSLTEAFTLIFVWSMIIFVMLQTRLVGGLLRDAAGPISLLLAIPGFLVVVGLIVENFFSFNEAY